MLNLTIEHIYETYRDEQHKNYFVEIVTFNKHYEAWLCNDNIGIKLYMFGIGRNHTKCNFLDMVNCQLEDYINIYENLYVN